MALCLEGCFTVRWTGIQLFYNEAPPAARVVRDIAYVAGDDDIPERHRLDLYLPDTSGWPGMIFVHGGGWNEGSKDFRVAGADIYGNIGRFYANQGIGVAVINYRLQPKYTWRDQVNDVARAVAWMHAHAADYGGDPERLFLAGHSAGAQLTAFTALAPEPLQAEGLTPKVLCGAIVVSGVAYDILDQRTYQLGAKERIYRLHFQPGSGDDWKREASAATYIGKGAPPFLLLHAATEWPSLHRQNELLNARLRAAGNRSRLIVVPGQSHSRMVLQMSRPDNLVSDSVLEFLRDSDIGCARPISPR